MTTYDVWSKFFFFWLNFLLDLFLGLRRKSSSSASSRSSSSILSSESELRSRVVTDKFEVLKSTPCTWGISSILNNKNQMNIFNFLFFSNFKSCWHVFIFQWRQNERISNLKRTQVFRHYSQNLPKLLIICEIKYTMLQEIVDLI